MRHTEIYIQPASSVRHFWLLRFLHQHKKKEMQQREKHPDCVLAMGSYGDLGLHRPSIDTATIWIPNIKNTVTVPEGQDYYHNPSPSRVRGLKAEDILAILLVTRCPRHGDLSPWVRCVDFSWPQNTLLHTHWCNDAEIGDPERHERKKKTSKLTNTCSTIGSCPAVKKLYYNLTSPAAEVMFPLLSSVSGFGCTLIHASETIFSCNAQAPSRMFGRIG